jgi:uncharacterized protein YbcI
MPERSDVDVGGEVLSRLSNVMVTAQKRYFGKGPVLAKSYMFDDMLFIVMRGGLTVAEETMMAFDQVDLVRQFRQVFENEMAKRIMGMIEEVTGRKVLTHNSQILFEPTVVIEMFVFDSAQGGAPQAATAEGQVSQGTQGEATNQEALDPPSEEDQAP